MLYLKGHDFRNVFRLCSIDSGPQPILAIADQSITSVEEADPSCQASTPKDRWLAHRTHKRVIAKVEVRVELDVEASLSAVVLSMENADVPVDQLCPWLLQCANRNIDRPWKVQVVAVEIG
jgi:hypothetical protein